LLVSRDTVFYLLQAVARMVLHLSAVYGIASFVVYVGDADFG
jgi:hypothetical protein